MTAASRSGAVLGLTSGTVFASGVLSAVGVAFLVAMFLSFGAGATVAGQAFGRANDVLVMVSYPLAIPAILALRAELRTLAPVASALASVVAIVAIVAIAVLQALLVSETLTFEQQVGPVSIAFLVLGASLVAIGWVGRSPGVLPDGLRMGLVGATYVGYPIWAIWVARRIRPHDPES